MPATCSSPRRRRILPCRVTASSSSSDTSRQQLPDPCRHLRSRQPGQPRQRGRLPADGLRHPQRRAERRRQRLQRVAGRQHQPDGAAGASRRRWPPSAANLDPSAATIAGPPGPAAYTSKTSVVTYDNIGNAVTLDVYMAKTGANTWQTSIYDSASGAAAIAGGTKHSPSTRARPARVCWPRPARQSLTVAIPGGSAFTMDLAAMTQVASSFDFKATVDGNAPSAIEKVRYRRDRAGHGDPPERRQAAELPDRARQRPEPGQSDAGSRQRLLDRT